MYLGSNCVSWSTTKQSTIARSSAGAEYRALALGAAKLTWISYILRDIGLPLSKPPVLFSDNIKALYLTINPVIHTHTKHIEIDYHFVREKVAVRNLITTFVSSSDQIADVFTKPLSKDNFYLLRTKLGVRVSP